MRRKLVLVFEIMLFILVFISLVMGLILEKEKYNVWAALFSLFFVVSEGARRYLDSKDKHKEAIEKEKYRNASKERDERADDKLERLLEQRNGKAPIGTKVIIIDSDKLPHKDKLTAPRWCADMDKYSGETAYITGYVDSDYKLDIDGGKNAWAGRWLRKCS